MWKSRYRAAGVQMRVGQLVELTGRFTLYAAKGRMNFDVFSVALAGEGNLRLQVANLARKLSAEGLMDPARKLPISVFPLTIGLVTSPRGDAVHDVLRTLRRRFPVARVLLAGVAVEGPQAPAGIVEGSARRGARGRRSGAGGARRRLVRGPYAVQRRVFGPHLIGEVPRARGHRHRA
ncbi:MAG: exodeoxyribonuclease VII large subunit [Senegalimassilia faecalis]